MLLALMRYRLCINALNMFHDMFCVQFHAIVSLPIFLLSYCISCCVCVCGDDARYSCCCYHEPYDAYALNLFRWNIFETGKCLFNVPYKFIKFYVRYYAICWTFSLLFRLTRFLCQFQKDWHIFGPISVQSTRTTTT